LNNAWLSLIPSLITIVAAIWSKKILPSLLFGLLIGSYFLNPSVIGGFETMVGSIVKTLSDKNNLQVLLFLYLFSGFIALIRKAGGIKAFSVFVAKFVKSDRGVFYTLWALLPITFIDCGFRIVGTGSITRSLAEKNKISKERFAFMLNNTASPVVELIPVATTFVGFNIANIGLGLNAAGVTDKPYDIWLHAIPYEFFSIIVLILTFVSIFYQWKLGTAAHEAHAAPEKAHGAMAMDKKMEDDKPEISPRIINLLTPMISVTALSVFFFWYFNEEPNKAMLVALFFSLLVTGAIYFFQKYSIASMTKDLISGGNDLMGVIAILVVAWSLGAVSQELHLARFIQEQLGGTMPAWSIPVSLFVFSSAVTYFMGSGWAAASLIMPFAISLAVTTGAGIPICVGAVITGGTFGDVTSPVAGMTNMASHAARADHMKYLKYANPYNFAALILAAVVYLAFGLMR
jgi:tetracycline resistance efflux pump